MSLNPVLTSQKIFARYVSYITTTFHLKNEELNNQIYTALKEESKFFKGPIIEATPPFLNGKTIEQLIKNGTLTQEFYNLQAKSLPLDRNLYLHQEESILKICKEKRNIVVATGTGSGNRIQDAYDCHAPDTPWNNGEIYRRTSHRNSRIIRCHGQLPDHLFTTRGNHARQPVHEPTGIRAPGPL